MTSTNYASSMAKENLSRPFLSKTSKLVVFFLNSNGEGLTCDAKSIWGLWTERLGSFLQVRIISNFQLMCKRKQTNPLLVSSSHTLYQAIERMSLGNLRAVVMVNPDTNKPLRLITETLILRCILELFQTPDH